MNLAIGMYTAKKTVNIRREPRIVENVLGNNRAGQLLVGTQRMIYQIVTNKDNSTWGRVSESDASGIALWVCIQNTNTVFMEPVNEYIPVPSQGEMTAEFISRFLALEAWAKTQGYK